MNEEDAYRSFCHVMFDLQIRNQYKPDMNAVQVNDYVDSKKISKAIKYYNEYH